MMALEQEIWVDVCQVDDIPVRGARVVKTPAGCIALFRTIDGAIFALDDKCPHKGGPLSQGIVHGRSVTCPLHNWVIGLDTGEAQGVDEGKTITHRTQVLNGRISLLAAIEGKAA